MLLVGEAPGADEDSSGRPFQGRAGQLLDRYLFDAGIKRHEVGVCNVLRCRPPENRDPHPHEVEACRAWLLADLLRYKPQTVVALGKHSSAFFLGVPVEEVKITQRRGSFFTWTHPQDPNYRCDVMLTLHPAFVAREERQQGSPYPVLFLSDLCAAKTLTDADTEALPANTGTRERPQFKADRKFTNGWHVGDKLYLVSREEERQVLTEIVPEWYFLIREEDLTPRAKAGFAAIVKTGIKDKRDRVLRIKRLARDPIPGWIRVYPEVPNYWVSKAAKYGLDDLESRRFVTVSPLERMAQCFEAHGIRTFEADVNPLRRFMTDNRIELEENLRLFETDIETCDKTMQGRPVAETLGRVPILSYAGRFSHDGSWVFFRARSVAPHHERELLESFFQDVIPRVDAAVAWNGWAFDFPTLFARARLHRIPIAPQATIWLDSMASFKKHHKYAAEEIQSYSLDNVAFAILGERKEPRTMSMRDFYETDPEGQKLYNLGDVDLMHRIEEKMGYVHVDIAQNVLSGNFANNVYVGLRVDSLVLAEGYTRGTHFRTKIMGRTEHTSRGRDDEDENEQFTGAFVLDPILGRHDNVANFDFSSLYPSVFTTWNISPETYIPPNKLPMHDPAKVTRCPRFIVNGAERGGSCFEKEPAGIIPTIYKKVKARRDYYAGKMAEAEPLSEEWKHLKRLEYVWKSLGLSMYGTMGSPFARIFNRAMAEAVTLSSQFLTRSVLALATRLGYQPIYADTDSCFIGIKDEKVDVPAFMEQAKVLFRLIGERYNCPTNIVKLGHEQTFQNIFFFSKKRYFGRLITQKGKPVPPDAPPEIKGLEVMRSDGVKFARKVQHRVIHGILDGWGPDDARAFLIGIRDQVFSMKLTADELRTTAGLSRSIESYKVAAPQVVVAKQMLAAGREVFVGQKIAWVVVDERTKTRVPVEDFKGEYDAFHYWNDKIWPPVERLVEVLWPEIDWAVMKVARPRKKGGRKCLVINVPDATGPTT